VYDNLLGIRIESMNAMSHASNSQRALNPLVVWILI